jgi:spore coat protein CotF
VLVNKNEDKFNKVLSTSKENGGLLASIGLKNKDIANEDSDLDGDSEEAPHNKSDLFDTSKDRIAKKAGAKAKDKGKDSDEEFDLGFSSIKKQADKEPAADAKKKKDDEEPTVEEQRKEIEEQFKSLYDNDPELRKALERSDVANFTVEEKYQIIEAYMQSGFNAAELQIELEDDDEKALAEMSEEDIELLNANFAQIYARDPELKAMLPDDISQLTLLQKY